LRVALPNRHNPGSPSATPAPPGSIGDSLHISVRVTNTGALEGDEVAQVYLSALDANVPVPIRSLRGFRRIHLAPGQTTILHFTIAPDAFTVIDDQMKTVNLPGKYEVAVGGGQPGSSRMATSDTVSAGIVWR
jgi:beta-glucosidase